MTLIQHVGFPEEREWLLARSKRCSFDEAPVQLLGSVLSSSKSFETGLIRIGLIHPNHHYNLLGWSKKLMEVTKISWGGLRIARIASRVPSNGARGHLQEATVFLESENVIVANSFAFHVFKFFFVIQAGESLNFVVNFFKHREEATRML